MLLMTAKVVVASIIALAGSGLTYEYVAEKMDERNFPPIGKMVDIGGYKLHMIDSGVSNGPTIVIDSGSGCNTLDWCLVAPEIAKFAHVITYDRAGYAWSDASPLPRTSENIVKELHTMLHNAGVEGPYILVGHSFGGINVRLFASTYPDEVAGMVLVDSSHEDQAEKLAMKDNSSMLKIMQAIYYLGIHRLAMYLPSAKATIAKLTEMYPAEIQKMYLSQRFSTKFMNTIVQEAAAFKDDLAELKSAGGLLGDKPLTVISQGKGMKLEEVAGMLTAEEVDLQNKVWPELQADLVTKSSRGKLIIAENSGHLIPQEQPQIIIDAVREMVEELTK